MGIGDWVWVPTPTVRDPRDGHWAHRSLVLRSAPVLPSATTGRKGEASRLPGPTQGQEGAR